MQQLLTCHQQLHPASLFFSEPNKSCHMQVCHCTVWKLQQWSRINRRVRGRPQRQPELVCCSRTGGTVGLLCLTSPIMPSWQLQEVWTSQVGHLKEHACDGVCVKHVAVAVSSKLICTHASIMTAAKLSPPYGSASESPVYLCLSRCQAILMIK